MGLLFLGYLGYLAFLWKRRDRFGKYQKNFVLFMVLFFFIAGLMEVLLPRNCCLKLLIIPIFGFGGYYIFYDAFLKN